jgi:hypothetical protein
MKSNFYYHITNFGSGLGSEGFNVQLSGAAAKRLSETVLPGDEYIKQFAYDIIDRCFKGRSMYGSEPVVFYKLPDGRNTCLLKGCEVPGVNGCMLYADVNELDYIRKYGEREISYGTHNVDTKEQAYTLLAIWLCWANIVESTAFPEDIKLADCLNGVKQFTEKIKKTRK